MTKLEQGDIYFIEFGSSKGHEYKKTRPAIVLTSQDNSKTSNMFTCVPLSSKLSTKFPDDIIIKKDSINNLMSDSLIKMHHLTACDLSMRIKKYIGKVTPDKLDEIKQTLKKMFSI